MITGPTVPRLVETDRLYLARLVPDLRAALDLANALALRGSDEVARASGREGIDALTVLMSLAMTCMRAEDGGEHPTPRGRSGVPRRRRGIDDELLQGVAGAGFDRRVTALGATRAGELVDGSLAQVAVGLNPQVRRVALEVVRRLCEPQHPHTRSTRT